MDNNWFKIWPSKLRSLVSSLPTGRMKANMTLLIVTYLDEGGLPDNDAKLGFLTGLPQEDIEALRPYFEFMGRCEGGRLYLDFAEDVIMERVEFAEKKANAGAKRWRTPSSNAEQTTPEDSSVDPPTAKQSRPKTKKAQLSTAKHSSTVLSFVKPDIQTDIQTCSDNANALSVGADAPIAPDDSLGAPVETNGRPPDPLFQEFCLMFATAHNGEPYAYKRADFVKLAELRKRYAKAQPSPWEVTTERFKQAAEHYFESEIATHTLADLCERFSTFYRSALDRFNKPVPEQSNHGRASPPGVETATHYADGREKPDGMKGFVC